MAGPTVDSGASVPTTVLDRVDPSPPIAKEEVVGPVLAVSHAGDPGEAISIHNRVPSGVSASISHRDLTARDTFMHAAQADIVHTRSGTAGAEPRLPCGGRKSSSFHSRVQGHAAGESFIQTRTIHNTGLGERSLWDVG